MTTTIVPAFPGYLQQNGCLTAWAPIPRVYSPPLLHFGVRLRTLDIGNLAPGTISLLIGGNGYFFKRITEESGALYLFVRGPVIEVWGMGGSVEHALELLYHRIQTLLLYRPVYVDEMQRVASSCWISP